MAKEKCVKAVWIILYDSYQNLETLKNFDGSGMVSKNADITIIKDNTYKQCKFKVTCHKRN
jgi:hypothetical protein